MKSPTLSMILATMALLITLTLSELCDPNDKKALLEIKKAFNDPYVLTSWKPDTDCCKWYCVTCSAANNHRIDSLTVFAGSVGKGPIPPQIGDLPYLEKLMFHKQPELTGPIPREVTKLKRLLYLRLSWNNLTGPVPGFLSELKNLFLLELSFNRLTGNIPPSLSSLKSLRSLRLDRNTLTGPVPSSFGDFVAEGFYLVLSHNRLSGEIPASLGKKNDFDYIDLSRNELEGDASVFFGTNKTTYFVDLSRNMLRFDLSRVGFSRSLATVDLSHNGIFGSLPVGLAALDNLGRFNVSYNRLCGEIPVGGNLQSFESSAYFHNRCLCGSPLESCK